MKVMMMAGLMLLAAMRPAQAQQTDTTADCGFSRINFDQLYRWFSPAVGRTLKATPLRRAATADARIMQVIPAGKLVYVVSDAPRTAWYQAIDQSTGKLGWIHNDLLELEREASIDSTLMSSDFDGPLKRTGAFKPAGSNQRSKTRLRIVNHYNVPLTVLLAGKNYTVPKAQPPRTASLTIEAAAGPQGYVIIVPDAEEIVDVFFGYADLKAGNVYLYEVEIISNE